MNEETQQTTERFELERGRFQTQAMRGGSFDWSSTNAPKIHTFYGLPVLYDKQISIRLCAGWRSE